MNQNIYIKKLLYKHTIKAGRNKCIFYLTVSDDNNQENKVGLHFVLFIWKYLKILDS